MCVYGVGGGVGRAGGGGERISMLVGPFEPIFKMLNSLYVCLSVCLSVRVCVQQNASICARDEAFRDNAVVMSHTIDSDILKSSTNTFSGTYP